MITSHIQYTPIKLHSGYFNRCYDVLKNAYDISNIEPVRMIFQKNRPSLIHILTYHQIGAKPSLKPKLYDIIRALHYQLTIVCIQIDGGFTSASQIF